MQKSLERKTSKLGTAIVNNPYVLMSLPNDSTLKSIQLEEIFLPLVPIKFNCDNCGTKLADFNKNTRFISTPKVLVKILMKYSVECNLLYLFTIRFWKFSESIPK
jgi:hypothetical protein